MKEAFIIGDIAGEFDALMRLVKHAPKGCPILAVGDICDRGPNSASVIDWFMKTPNADAVAGNHEHMMIDHCRDLGMYGKGIWLDPRNGGQRTLWSYDDYPNGVPEAHLDWLASRDFYKMLDGGRGCLVTHAPLNPQCELFAAVEISKNVKSVYHPDFDKSLMWNRRAPIARSFFQVFGHCSDWGLREFHNPGHEPAYAICIDQSRKQILTAFHWPTGEIFEVPYQESRPAPEVAHA